MSLLTDLVANASSAAGVGLLLDQVFVGQSGQQKILSHIEKQNFSAENLNTRLHKNLLFIRNEIFRRTLGSNFLSLRYFYRSAYLSIVFILVFAVYQNYAHGEVSNYITENPYNLSIFILFCVANLIIDYISLIQTNIFLSFSVSAKKISHTAFLIFADIMSTMGIFKFAYSSFIFIFILLAVGLVQNSELKNRDITISYDVSREGIGPPYSYTVEGTRIIHGNSDYRFLDVRFTSGEKYIDPVRFNNFRTDKSISLEQQNFRGTRFEKSADPYLILNSKDDIGYSLSYKLHPPAITLNGMTFAGIFTQVASVDYNFLNVMNPALATVQVKDMLGLRYGYNPFNNTKYCSLEPAGLMFNVEYANSFELKNCSEVLVGSSGESYGDTPVYYDWKTSIIRLRFPLTLFFASSFAPTLMIYSMAISLAFMGLLSGRLLPVQSVVVRYWARAPFGMFGFLVGLAISFL